jgi:uncharacterized protein GlcG (DUF336 family)
MLTLSQASDVVDAALNRARELELRPLTITVLDPGGHPLVVKREDGAGILRPQIAHAKAWGCLGTGAGAPRARDTPPATPPSSPPWPPSPRTGAEHRTPAALQELA